MLRYSRIALAAAFIALAVALGFLLAGVPNLELVTLTTFIAGGVLGPFGGLCVGVASVCLHSLLNPLGPPPFPLLFVAQLVGMGFAGAVGGMSARRLAGLRGWRAVVAFGALGCTVTLAYDVLTNVGVGIHLGDVWTTVIGGLAFTVMHLVYNTALFAVLGPRVVGMLHAIGQL